MKLFKWVFKKQEFIVYILASDEATAWHLFDKRIYESHDLEADDIFEEVTDDPDGIDFMFENDYEVLRVPKAGTKQQGTYWTPKWEDSWEKEKREYYGHHEN